MATIPLRYRHTGFVMVRATTDPGDLHLPVELDLDDPAAVEQEGLAWLGKTWSRSDVREALSMASPALSARVTRLLNSDSGKRRCRDVRRAILSTATYLRRWQRRPTPFGMFAGVNTATVGPATAKIGDELDAIARVDAEWLTQLVDELEQHPELPPRLKVVADNAGFVRDGRYIVAGRRELGARTPGPLREVSVRNTRPVQLALAAAASPIAFDALTTHLLARFPGTSSARIHAMLHCLVDQGVLITSLRPPMTAVDPLAYVIEALRAAGADRLPDLAEMLSQLEEISALLAQHNASGDAQQAGRLRSSVAAQMVTLAPGTEPPLATDVRLDADIAIPEPVLYEAGLAASVLLRLTSQPFGSAAWLDYHARYLARYGPGALVPVRDLVADSGLGYPDGYLGAPRARPAWRTLTERDATLLALIQKAALDCAKEIRLTDTDIQALTVGDHADIVLPQRVEVGFAVHATSPLAVDRGQFELRVTAAPRSHTSLAGRFAYLLSDVDRALLTTSNTAVVRDSAASAVQLSFPPRRRHNENVVRVAPLVPDVVSISEFPANGTTIGVDDLAVTADAEQLYLVHRPTGRRVAPQIPHALETTVHTPPLARFLAEVADARSAAFGPLDLGAARTLPYVPRIRYRRIVLSAARWVLTTADLPHTNSRHYDQADWDAALQAWRDQWRVPARIVVHHGELRLPLDMDQRLDRTLLRTRLDRADRLELHEDAPPGAHDWIGRPAEFLIPMTAIAPSARKLPPTVTPAAVLRPGDSTVVHARILGSPARFDDILTRHLRPFVDHLAEGLEAQGIRAWWVRRHRDMIRVESDQYLAVCLRLATPDLYGEVAARLTRFSDHLETRGLPAELTLVPYAEQPGRYGYGPALAAAEQVFASDTRCAITQIAMAEAAGIPAQALAAASMAQLSAAFAAEPETGYRALLGCLKRQSGLLDRALSDYVRRLSDPRDNFRVLTDLPGGEQVTRAWQARDEALRAYYAVLASQRDPSTVLRSLLHEHHVRALGVDPDFERVTGRLARAAALCRLASRSPATASAASAGAA